MTPDEAQFDEHIRQAEELLDDLDKLPEDVLSNFQNLLWYMRTELKRIADARVEK